MKATYQCNRYYKLIGSKDVACRNGQWDDPPSCLCEYFSFSQKKVYRFFFFIIILLIVCDFLPAPCSVSSIPAKYNLQPPGETRFIEDGKSAQFHCISGIYRYFNGRWYETGTGLCKNGVMHYTGCKFNDTYQLLIYSLTAVKNWIDNHDLLE